MTKSVGRLVFLCSLVALLLAGCGGGGGGGGDSGSTGSTTVAIPAGGGASVMVGGAAAGDPQESIYVRKIGTGPKTMVLIPGNNTSGKIFEGMFDYVKNTPDFGNAYTVYTFDYRGSGLSSYNKTITSLKDFASDFEKAMARIEGFPTSGVTLVGYSMGFGVAMEMVIANPARYSNVVSLTGIGSRGVRVSFNATQVGTDPAGQVWAANDWVKVADDAKGIVATAFQQRSWQGPARSFDTIKFTWDMVVYNDVLKYNFGGFLTGACMGSTCIGDTTFTSSPYYTGSLNDGLTIKYMPESLYYSHKFNVSTSDVKNTNADGSVVTIRGDGRLGSTFSGKNVLLVKATTDFNNWRGDQVIYDNYTATTKYDLKQAGGTVTAVMVDPNQGYDHGFPVAFPAATLKLIDTFARGALSSTTAASALGVTVKYYDHSETTWETATFTGF